MFAPVVNMVFAIMPPWIVFGLWPSFLPGFHKPIFCFLRIAVALLAPGCPTDPDGPPCTYILPSSTRCAHVISHHFPLCCPSAPTKISQDFHPISPPPPAPRFPLEFPGGSPLDFKVGALWYSLKRSRRVLLRILPGISSDFPSGIPNASHLRSLTLSPRVLQRISKTSQFVAPLVPILFLIQDPQGITWAYPLAFQRLPLAGPWVPSSFRVGLSRFPIDFPPGFPNCSHSCSQGVHFGVRTQWRSPCFLVGLPNLTPFGFRKAPPPSPRFPNDYTKPCNHEALTNFKMMVLRPVYDQMRP